jgi:hypothetical protein
MSPAERYDSMMEDIRERWRDGGGDFPMEWVRDGYIAAIEAAVAAERDRCASTIRRVKNDLQLPLSVSDLKILDEIGSAQHCLKE